MRNAAAHFDDDFDIREPARKPSRKSGSARTAASRKKKKGSGRWQWLRPNFDMQKVARYAAVGMSATVALGIMVNALVLQKSRHPAPLFGKSIALGQPVVAPSPTKTALTAKPEPVVRAQPAASPLQTETPQPVKRQEASAAPRNASADAIGQLLETGTIAVDRSETKTVIAAQRALAHLGYAVKASGTVGPQTKKAIETYEKARHLPVKGELSARLVKRLVAESAAKDDR